MATEYRDNFCPVCGYDIMPHFKGHFADEICPSCGIQFNYEDTAGGSEEMRKGVYLEWRLKWIKDGKKWFYKDDALKPENWNPDEQLKNLLKN